MGNSAGNIKDFWDQWRSLPRVIGGAIWEFKDQGLVKYDSATGKPYYAYGGDFGERYFDNFTIKGVVAADGRPKAAMYECKRVFQPIQAEWSDSSKAIIKIINRSPVLSSAYYNGWLSIRENGKLISRKPLEIPAIEAGTSIEWNLAKYLPKFKSGAEYHADIEFTTKEDKPWAARGFVIASNQLSLTPLVKHVSLNASVAFVEKDQQLVAQAGNVTVSIDKLSGALTSYKKGNIELMGQALLPHFTRPQTDNDRKGWKTHRVLKQWYDNQPQLKSVAAAEAGGLKGVQSTYTMVNDSVELKVFYTVDKEGTVKVDYQLKAKPGLPNIPKVGMQTGVNKAFTQIQYFGRGPLENYIDRNYGFNAGVFDADIYDFMEPYVVPQENGNRTDVRWMNLYKKGTKDGISIVADSLLSMSAWPYSEKNIIEAKHTNKLYPADHITLNIDLIQMGVGGNDSWSEVAAPLEQYQLKAGQYRYSFYIRPL
ncbi:beta-galactosidase small subunit-related protein [Niabella hibiscisoli]|uniref:beta-galactosidase domain 4-containing protein n=1 Tax=Niabella hibiscisoli TaxID=1825928 RepID=UPI001F0E1BB2|nr:beta-galactosidase domain 4-containing protein [Niabella hibiscisoli]MCH5719614.1 DUF4981 domain-containing protein [Niabella hibiscisoli]